MFRKLLSVVLAGLLTTTLASVPNSAQSQATTQSPQAEKIRTKVMRIGVGRARVQVKLMNHMKLKGFIGQIADEGFSLVDPKSGTVTPVPYDQVLEVKNISRSALIALGIAVGTIAGLMLLVALSLRGS
jgi:hypothetical protein